MLYIIVSILVGAVILLAFATRLAKTKKHEEIWPYEKKPVMSVREQELYWALCSALSEHLIFSQVNLGSILKVKSREWKYRNQICQKYLDFVVCEKSSNVVAVIELDDATHLSEDRKKTDAVKDKALAAAGVRVIRWQAKKLPDRDVIRDTILRE